MQLIHTNKKIVSLAILLGAILLLPLSFAVAETNIYQEVITSSNTGGQSSNRNSTEESNSTIEVTNTTVINGEEYSYYFSTSTPNRVEHQVTIIDGIPVSGTSLETSPTHSITSDELNIQEYKKYEDWIISMISLLNYLQLYVAKTF